MENHLRESVHYDYCRKLGQLGPVQGIPVENADRNYLRGCEELGQKVGDVKPSYLRRELDWLEKLGGVYAG